MKTLLSILLSLIISNSISYAQSEAVGYWEGKLSMNGVSIRIGFEVKEKDGILSSTMDSPDQGAFDLACDASSFENGVLKIEMKQLGINYTGKPKGDEMEGTFVQGGMALDLDMKRVAAGLHTKIEKSPVQKLSKEDKKNTLGYWQGVLKIRGVELRLAYKVKADGEGLNITMDSPDQGVFDMKASDFEYKDGKFIIYMNNIGIRYEGTPKGDEMKGTFHQGGMELPLDMKRDENVTESRVEAKPQEPKGPFNYEIKEVVFENSSANIKLAGTLTMPKDCNNCPAAILISGSGPQDRDETMLGHKPFWVIANYLTNRGIAVLRFDDRGVGGSEGDFTGATSADFMTDVEAAFLFLKTQQGINQNKIGLVGHSEGGLIAPMLAAQNKEVGFIISLAGPGVIGKKLLPEQIKLIASANQASKEEAEYTHKNMKKICNLVAKSYNKGNQEEIKTTIRKLLEKGGHKTTSEQIDATVAQYTNKWFQFFMQYDPVKDWKKVTCPVLALNGSKDLQVPADANLERIAKALKQGKNKNYKVVKFEGLNHLFQKCKTGSPLEYAVLDETFSEEVMGMMAIWINEL